LIIVFPSIYSFYAQQKFMQGILICSDTAGTATPRQNCMALQIIDRKRRFVNKNPLKIKEI